MRIDSNRSDQSQRTENQETAKRATASAGATSRGPTAASAEMNLASTIQTLAASRSRLPWIVPTVTTNAPSPPPTMAAAPSAPATLERQIEAAICRVEAKAESGRKLLNEVNAHARRIPTIKPTAEAAVGAVLATSTVGNMVVAAGLSLATWNKEYLGRATKDAENAAGMMFGRLCNQAALANAQRQTFYSQYAAFSATNRQLRQAMRAGDHKDIVDLTRRMETQDAAMRASADKFAATAKEVQKLDREFEQAVVHAVAELVLKAVTLGLGGVPGEHAVQGVAGKGLATLYGATAESAVLKVGFGIAHLVHAATAPEQKAVAVTGRAADAMREPR